MILKSLPSFLLRSTSSEALIKLVPDQNQLCSSGPGANASLLLVTSFALGNFRLHWPDAICFNHTHTVSTSLIRLMICLSVTVQGSTQPRSIIFHVLRFVLRLTSGGFVLEGWKLFDIKGLCVINISLKAFLPLVKKAHKGNIFV